MIDPDTGDEIGIQPGRAVGMLRVISVRDKYIADLVSGDPAQFRICQRCRKIAQTILSSVR